jgi:regulator of cell morphogenesis and NO signaling
MLTLKELAIHVPASIRLFEKYELDYYRNGWQSLRSACLGKGLSYDAIDAELSELTESEKIVHSFTLEDMSTERLVDYINGRYHSNEHNLLKGMQEDMDKLLADPECKQRTLLERFVPLFLQMKTQLLQHSDKEDEVLFPLMRRLSEQLRNKVLKTSPDEPATLKRAIHLLQQEHEAILQLLDEVKAAAQQFSVPANASPEYGVLMHDFLLFEQDMHMHLHIENNILFPRLLALCETIQLQNA